MLDIHRASVGWTDQQWSAIDAAIAAEVKRVRVLDEIIPTTNVRSHDKTVTIDLIDAQARTIDDNTTIPLSEISVYFILDKQQVQQPELTRALALARRAASDFARIENEVLLRGLQLVGNVYQPDGILLPAQADIQRGRNRELYDGLSVFPRNDAFSGTPPQSHLVPQSVGLNVVGTNYGPMIVPAVARAIGLLEAAGHMGPYHLILGSNAFIAALTPSASLALPKDGIEPLLASPIRRSSALPADQGVLISVGGDPTDRVVAVEPTLRFVDTTPQDQYRFRVYGVLALRRKEPEAVARLRFQ